MIIIGIDPGTTQIGYGVIKKESNSYSLLESGAINIKKESTAERLQAIEKRLDNLVNEHSPDRVGVEKIFFSKNRKTAIKVAQARGVILLSLSKGGVPIFEVSPSEAKMSVTGSGNASKESVAKMVGHFINSDVSGLQKDTTDALAIAIAVSTKINNEK